MRVAKTDVHAALERAARNIMDAAGKDRITSRADIEQKLETLDGNERVLTDMFYRFVDHRDHRPGARITARDVDRALDYARRKLVDRYDVNRNGLSKDEVARMSRTGQLAVALARELRSSQVARAEPRNDLSENERAGCVELAISPVFGHDEKLAHRIELDALPAAVRTALEESAQDIRSSRAGVDGISNYRAEVDGFFAVHRSAEDPTVVAYAVVGYGKGEPDYHDGVVLGHDLDGTFIHFDGADDGYR